MDYRPITVITSKKAQKDIERIRGIHKDLIGDIQAHQQRVAGIKQQNATAAATKTQADREFKLKQQEIAAKRAPQHG